jgi:PAT family beta-lactamase induction signal transducer AmpG
MSFGKAVGWSCSAAASGGLLVAFGLPIAGLVAALVSGMLLIAFVFVREREGERRLPWTSGDAQTAPREAASFGHVFRGINSVLWVRTSVVMLLIMFFDGLVHGYGHALMPIAAVKVFGFTTTQWSQLVAAMGLIGAVFALGFGPMIDRFGAKRMLVFTLTLVALHAFMLAQTQHLWEDTTYVRVMLSLWVMMNPLTMVCVIALAMAICSPSVSATQFAIYMSAANLGSAAGSKAYGLFADRTSYVENYIILGVFVLVSLATILFHRPRHGFHLDAPQLPDSGEAT